MQAIVIDRTGGPEVLSLTDLPEPAYGPGDVLVDVAWSGVNYHDVYVRTGQYRKPLPYVPGIEGSGTVSGVGPAVTGLAVGDRVAWVNQPGGYATRVCLPADRVVPVPDRLPIQAAAAVLLQGLTAHYLSHDTYPVRPGDMVVVHAAAGGVGLLLCQLVKRRGGRVIGIVSSPAKAQVARAAGADETIETAAVSDVAAAVRALTGGRGADVVYDGVGAPTFAASLASLRPRGMFVAYGQAGGLPEPVDLLRLRDAGSVYLIRPDLNDYIAGRAELLARARAVFALVGQGLQIRVGGRYRLAEAGRAHDDLEGRRTTGKLLLGAQTQSAD